MTLYDTITSLESVGVFDVALPFILIFTISFAILQKIKLFGENKKNIDVIVALVLAFVAIRNVFLISMLNRFLPNIAMFLIIILMFLLLIGTFGGSLQGFKGAAGVIAIILSLIFVLSALSSDFLDSFGYSFILPPFLADLFYDYQTRAMILFIGGIVLVIYLVTSTGESSIWQKVKEIGEEIIGKGRK